MDYVSIASGFHEDCCQLLELFRNYENYTFPAFCKAWQELKFSLVFLCRKTYAEMLEFCEEALNIAKKIALSSSELIDKVGGIYLLYGLYYKIPVDNVKIRVTMKEWQSFLEFHEKIKEEEFYDTSYIFVKLVTDNAFCHCLFENEYSIEKSFQGNQDVIDDAHSVLPELIEQIEEGGELLKLEKLSKLYDEQKAKLLSTTSSNKLQLFDKDFVEKIVNELEYVEEKKQMLTGMRRRTSKMINFKRNKDDKSKLNTEDKIRPKLGHAFDTDSSDDENMHMKFDFEKDDSFSLPQNLDSVEDYDLNDTNNDNNDNREDCMETSQ